MFLSTASSVSGISSTAAAMQKMSISAFLGHEDLLGWIMVITLCVMSISSWYFIIANTMRSAMVRKAADKVVKDFWANASPQEAMHMLEAQPQNEPFSKIALDAIAVAAHHQQAGADGSRLAQALHVRSLLIVPCARPSIVRACVWKVA